VSVTARGLVKRFTESGTPAVRGASFCAPAGAITSVLGPSGSGKTTILRLLAGLELPDEGAIEIDGRDMTRVPVRERHVGFVFQSYALFQNMTVRDNVAFGLSIRRAPRGEVEARVDELLELVQLADYGHRLPSELSGGQQQRVAFARALAPRPVVLLLDEPFGALDARVRLELRDWLRALHERTPITTLLVTHDQDEALEVSAHVVLMHEGQVVQAGSPHDLYDHPATPFVASFLGGASVIRGRVEGGRMSVGALSTAAPAGARDGESVQAFVRPHDVRIAAKAQPHDKSVARVERLSRVGGFVKVELCLPSGDVVTVQLPKPEVDALGVTAGDRVVVDLGEAKVFVEDYSI
jgi:sulfate transport system ATP-binding protein